MNDDSSSLTKADLKQTADSIIDSVGEAIQDLTDMVAKKFGEVDERFDKVDQRFEQVDARFDRLEMKVDNVLGDHEVRLTKLERDA